jgi:hypothetical protein
MGRGGGEEHVPKYLDQKDVALALDKNLDAAPAPTLLYSKAKFSKRTKV